METTPYPTETDNYIEFRQVRDFSGVLSATFAFLRQNFKDIAMMILTFVGPLIVIDTALNFYFLQEMDTTTTNSVERLFQMYQNFSLVFLASLIVNLLAYSIFAASVLLFIKRYIASHGAPLDFKELLSPAIGYVPTTVVAYIITIVLFVIGLVLLIVPGVYVAIALSFVFIALIIEEKGLMESFARSFSVVSDNWWATFGLMLVLVMIAWALGVAVALPISVIGFAVGFASGEGFNPATFSQVFVLAQPLIAFLNYIVYSAIFIGLTFKFFSIVEAKERPHLIEKVESLDSGPGNGTPQG